MRIFKRITWYITYVLQSWVPFTRPDKKRRILKRCLLPFAIVNAFFKIIKKEIYFPRIELVITTKCSLKCKDCANLIQAYKTPEHMPYSDLCRNMDALSQVVDGVGELKIMGGEPFLHPELEPIIKMVSKYPIVKSIMITTNGSVIPKDSLIGVLKENHVRIIVSGYEITKIKASQFIERLGQNGIYCEHFKDMEWIDYGGTDKRNRSEKQLKQIFANCGALCCTYIKGQLHMCPRSGNGLHSKSFFVPERDYIDFNLPAASVAPIKNKAWDCMNLTFIEACDYCDAGCFPVKKIPSALQG